MIPRISVKKVMSQRLVTVDHQLSLDNVAKQMALHDVGSLLVTKEKEIVGIITETDMVRRVLAQGMDLSATRVEEVMSYPVHHIEEGEGLSKAHEMMGEHHIRHLLVTRNGEPAGIVSVRNLLDSIYEWASRIKS